MDIEELRAKYERIHFTESDTIKGKLKQGYAEWLEKSLIEQLILHNVSHTLRELNSQIELIDEILSKSGAVTRRKLERLKESKIKDLQTTIKNSCG